MTLQHSFSSVFQDLDIAASSEITIGFAGPVPDSIPIVTKTALPEHDYSVSSVPTVSSLLQMVAKLKHENSEQESKIKALQNQNNFLQTENSELKSKMKLKQIENKALNR